MIVTCVESIEKTLGMVESILLPVALSSTIQFTVKQFEAPLGQVGKAIVSDAFYNKSIVVVLVVKLAVGFFGQRTVAMKFYDVVIDE